MHSNNETCNFIIRIQHLSKQVVLFDYISPLSIVTHTTEITHLRVILSDESLLRYLVSYFLLWNFRSNHYRTHKTCSLLCKPKVHRSFCSWLPYPAWNRWIQTNHQIL